MRKNFTFNYLVSNKKNPFLLFFFLFSIFLINAQTQVSTTTSFSFNNGSGVTTFNFQNTNNYPITIDNVYTGLYSGSGTYNFYIWYNNTPVNGQPAAIPTGAGWILAAQQSTFVPSSSTQHLVLSNVGLTIPANTTVGMAVGGFDSGGSGAMGYYTIPSTIVYTFSNGGCNIISGLNVGYSSTTYSASPSFYPRGFVGSIEFSQAIPPDDAGISSLNSPNISGNYCPGTDNVSVNVMNYGGVDLNTVDVDWTVNGTAQNQHQLTFNPPLQPGQSQAVILGPVNITNTPTAVTAWTSNPNGNQDSDLLNDTLSVQLVANYTEPIVNITPGDTAFCQGTSVTLNHGNSDNNTTVLWSDGSSGNNLVVNSTGQYTVSITNQNGCVSTDAVNIVVQPIPVVNLGNDTNYCTGNSITLHSGNTNPTSMVLWSDGSTGNDLVVSSPGQYYVGVLTQAGCFAADTVNISVAPSPSVDLGNDVTFCEGSSYLIQSGNTDPNATVVWNNGTISNDLIVATSGTYTCTITNQYSCSATDSINVTVDPLPIILGLSETHNADGSFTYLGVGVSNANSYTWLFSDGTVSNDMSPTHTYPPGDGIYTVTLEVSNDCGTTTYIMQTDNNPDTDYIDGDTSGPGGVGLTHYDFEEFNIFPNPAKNFVNIESPVTIEHIVINDILGNIIYKSYVGAEKQRIELENVSSGTYFLNMALKNGQRISRKIEILN